MGPFRCSLPCQTAALHPEGNEIGVEESELNSIISRHAVDLIILSPDSISKEMYSKDHE